MSTKYFDIKWTQNSENSENIWPENTQAIYISAKGEARIKNTTENDKLIFPYLHIWGMVLIIIA